MTLTYTNSNKTENNTDTLDSHTYDYTFPIDIVKVDANNKKKKLANAEFSIKRVSKSDTGFGDFRATDHVAATQIGTDTDSDGNAKVTTAANTGLATFSHLDEGYYEIWESKAPSGYAQNQEHFYIGIAPAYDSTGKLTAYTVTQYKSDGSVVGSTVKDAEGKDTDEKVTSSAALTAHTTITDDTHDTLTVGDTKMSSLPSTGARSALILTIAGVAVMITVMAASRRKKMAE